MHLFKYLGAVFVFMIPRVLSKCTQISPCACKRDDGSKIDLSPLASSDGTARFKDVADKNKTSEFSYNPCLEFTENDCNSVAVCLLMIPGGTFNIGTQDSATFREDSQGRITIGYSFEQFGELRQSFVTLTCDRSTDGSLLIVSESNQQVTYNLELRTKYACSASSDHGQGSTTGLSTGSVLVILLFVSIVLYFVVGIPVQKYARRQTGVNVIPFVGFWMGLPGLVKDGTFFVVRRGKHGPYQQKI